MIYTNYPIPRPSNLGGAILMVGCVDKKKEVTTDISEYLIFDNVTEDTVNIRSISNKDKIVGNVVIPSTDKEGRTIVSLNIDNLETNESPAFYGCPNVTSISTPSTLSTIGKYSFVNCKNLNEVIVDVGNSSRKQFNNLSSDLFDSNSQLKLIIRDSETTIYNQTIKYTIMGYPWGLNEDQIVVENGDIPLTEKDIPNAEPKKSILYMASRDIMVKELDPNFKNGNPQLFIYPEPDPDKQNQDYILYRVLWDDERNEKVWMRMTVTIVDDIPNTEWVYASDDIIQKGHPFWYYKS